MKSFSRRSALTASLFGAGMIGLRSLATGLPISFLLNPKLARADMPTATPQFLVVATSGNGDASNCNVPGTYDLPAAFPSGSVVHPDTPEMAPAPLTLGGTMYNAARPWSTLPKEVLARTCFFHHATLTANHGDEGRVLKLMGAVRRDEMLISFLAKKLAPGFGTVQTQPIGLAAETVQFQGKYQPRLTPTGLKSVLSPATGSYKTLQQIRDTDLDAMNALLKQSRSTSAEKAYLDQLALSQTELRKLSDQFANDVANITANDSDNQALAAALLIKMGVSPVILMHLPFSGDNHTDQLWASESTQTVGALAAMNKFFAQLKTYGLQDSVTFALLNVFGRELGPPGQGRGHNPAHNVAVLIGKGFKPCVVGGIDPKGSAVDIDPATGAASPGAAISVLSSLASLGKTLARGVGLDQASIDDQLTSGLPVEAALA